MRSASFRWAAVAAAVLTSLGVSSCGIRVPHSDVVSAAKGQAGPGGVSSRSGDSVSTGTGGSVGGAVTATGSADTGGPAASGQGSSTASGVGSGSGAGSTVSTSTGGPAGPSTGPTGPNGGTQSASSAGCGTGLAGPGVTATTIKLGFQYDPDVSDASAGLGGSTWRPGEPDSDYAAFIKYFNATGGICGRQIVPVPWNDMVVSGESQETQDQAACTAWTQDNKVLAADVTADFQPIDACMKAAGSMVVQVNTLAYHDNADLATYPEVITPFTLTFDRLDPLLVASLATNGFFDPGAKVGLLYTNLPAEVRSVKNILVPELKAKGVKVVDQAAVTPTVSIDTLGQSESQTDEAVLRFQSEGIDHVIAPYDDFSLQAFIMRAQQQSYSPRYAMASSDSARLGQSAAYNRAIAVNWAPALSWAEAQTNPATATCLAILKQEGVPPPEDQGELTLVVCDFLTFLRQTLDRAPDLTEAGLLAAAKGLPPQNADEAWSWSVNPTQRDGAAAFRVSTYSGGANGQWRYLTPLAPVS